MTYRLATMLPFLLATSPVSTDQTPPATSIMAAPAAALDATARREVVAKFSDAMRDRYIFPELGDQVATKVRGALAAGEYDTFTSPAALAGRLSADAAAIAHDKHLNIWSILEPRSRDAPPAMPRAEAGVTRADKLAGNIGYIEVIGFPPAQFFKRAADTAMSSLAGSRALIIDVRRNGGGDPEAVAYLVSFLIPPGRPINDIVSRTEKTNTFTRQSYSSISTPVRFAGVPIYVLTSKNTFSGGEEFAYDVQALKRGTLIGEVTGGGANPTGPVDLGHGIVATIPFGRAENPVTKANWEGLGVRPDKSVAASGALRVALETEGHKPVAEIATASLKQVFGLRSTPLPGSEAAVRKLIAAYTGGEPDYSIMVPDFATATRAQLSQLRAQLAPLGQLRSIAFYRPDDLGGDEYKLSFENGARKMALVVGQDGKIIVASSVIPLEKEE